MRNRFLLFFMSLVMGSMFMALESQAQRVFYGFGYNATYGTGIGYAYVPPSTIGTTTAVTQGTYVGLGYTIGMNINAVELSEDMSLGVAGDLNLGGQFYISDEFSPDMPISFGLAVPVLLQFKYGNFSTASSNKDFGFGVGAGVNVNGFFGPYISDLNDSFTYKTSNTNFAAMPTVRASMRWWSGDNKLRELNLTASFGANSTVEGAPGEVGRTMFKLSWISYYNY